MTMSTKLAAHAAHISRRSHTITKKVRLTTGRSRLYGASTEGGRTVEMGFRPHTAAGRWRRYSLTEL